ncbi:hypothetical protein AURDEDRAFT_131794, partial [Auricularia subglabra TFB-10046 SS5]
MARLEDLAARCKKLPISADRWRAAVRQPFAEEEARARARVMEAAACAIDDEGDIVPEEESAPAAVSESAGRFAAMLTPPTTPHHIRMAPAPPHVSPEDESDSDDAQEVEDDSSLEVDDGEPFEDREYDPIDSNEPKVVVDPYKPLPDRQLDVQFRKAVVAFKPQPSTSSRSLYRDGDNSFTRINVSPAALKALSNGASINEEILYAGMASLKQELAPARTDIAFLQPYDFTMWQSSAQRTRIYRQIQRTQFWSKN